MMKPSLRNKLIGTLAALIGLGCGISATVVATKAMSTFSKAAVDTKSYFSPATRAQCTTAAQQAGLEVAIGDGPDIEVSDRNALNDGKTALIRASLALTQCPGYRLAKFCMGRHCPAYGSVYGLSMTMSPETGKPNMHNR